MSTPQPTAPPGAPTGASTSASSLLPWRRSWWRAPSAAQASLDVLAEVLAFTGVVVLAGAAGNPEQTLDDPFWLVFVLLLGAVTVLRTRFDARRERDLWSDLAWRERAAAEQLDAAERVVRAGVAPGDAGKAVLALEWARTAERAHGWRVATWVLAPGLAAAVSLQPLFGGSWAPSWTPSWVAGGVVLVAGFLVARRWRRGLRRRQEQLRVLLAQAEGAPPL